MGRGWIATSTLVLVADVVAVVVGVVVAVVVAEVDVTVVVCVEHEKERSNISGGYFS